MLVVLFAASFGISLLSAGAQFAANGGVPNNDKPTLTDLGISVVFSLINWAVQSYLMAGLFRAACKQVRGEPISANDVFSAGEVTGTFMLAGLLVGICVFFGLLLLIIPGLIIAGRLMLVFPLIADGRMSATQAMESSWSALRGQSLKAFVFQLVVGVVSGIGACLCGIGILLTYPIYFLATAIIYRDYFNVKSKDAPSIEWPELA
jgi:uncharacterized membrane protein